MDNLRLILIIVATLAIIALLIHGFWINKKERSTLFSKEKLFTKSKNDEASQKNRSDDTGSVQTQSQNERHKVEIENDRTFIDECLRAELGNKNEKFSEPPVQNDLFMDELPPKIPSGLSQDPQNKEEITFFSVDEHDSIDIEKQKKLNFDDDTELYSDSEGHSSQHESIEIPTPGDVLIMHVSGINGSNLNGSTLLNSILAAGFQHGDMQIFHRHIDPAGNGAILFSLANMIKPGHLNPETMPNMVTPGISLFMMIPSFGDDQQNFKMMLQSAQRIADDVKGVVLDDEYHMLTPQKINDYKERIKKLVIKPSEIKT